MTPLLIRPLTGADLPAAHAIYSHHVLTGCSSFELEPPSLAQMQERCEAVHQAGWPYLVAERDGTIAGYAYAGTYRPRQAYRFTVEDSIYIAPEFTGQGIGRLLLAELLAQAAARGARQMLAVIGDVGANTASVALHRAAGFSMVGVFADVGWKHGAWRSSGLMQRRLGAGAGAAP